MGVTHCTCFPRVKAVLKRVPRQTFEKPKCEISSRAHDIQRGSYRHQLLPNQELGGEEEASPAPARTWQDPEPHTRGPALAFLVLPGLSLPCSHRQGSRVGHDRFGNKQEQVRLKGGQLAGRHRNTPLHGPEPEGRVHGAQGRRWGNGAVSGR